MAKSGQKNNIYNETDINETNDDEYESESTENPFLDAIPSLNNQVFIQASQVDEQKLIQDFFKYAQRRSKSRKLIKIIFVVTVPMMILSVIFGIYLMFVFLFFALMLLTPPLILIECDIHNVHYKYKEYVIQKAIGNKVEDMIYKNTFDFPFKLYKSLNVIKKGNKYCSEDIITGKYNDVYFVQSDLDIKYENGSTHKVYFSGRWIIIDYPKKFSGTVVVNDNDFDGADREDLEVIKLENSYFNEIFTVKTSDMQLGYYILTPQIVERFINLKKNINGDIIACFKDGLLHIFVNDGKNSFEPDIDKVDFIDDVMRFVKDFSLVSETIDILKVNHGVYAQSEIQTSVNQTQYQNHSNSTPSQSSGSGIGIQGGRF